MTLSEVLSENTRAGELCEPLEGGRVRCVACGHRCPIPAGFSGVCRVRSNRAGSLRVPFGYVAALQCDPIEKKPFFHALPGASALSFGMFGCSFHCAYCQNWVASQTLRDFRSGGEIRAITPAEIVRAARACGAAAVVSTYNEPLVTIEWAAEVFRAAREAGFVTGIVSNGNATPEALAYLRPCLDLFKVDLKTMDDGRYHRLGGRLAPVLDSIAAIHAMGFWLEVVTLIVPGFNDSREEIRAIARFLGGLSSEIPWHVTAFHRAYRMTEPRDTTAAALLRAAAVGQDAGLAYVYAGNAAGESGDLENTRCARCGTLLIERRGYRVLQNRITDAGRCDACGLRIPGVWRARGAKTGDGLTLHVRCG